MRSRSALDIGGLVAPLAAVATWQLLVTIRVLDYDYLPAPSEVAVALADLAGSGELVEDLGHTVAVALSATAAALLLGGALGLAIGLLPAVRTWLMASIDFLRTIPAVALAPIALLAMGPAATTEFALASWAATWPILLNTVGGVATVPPRLHDVARTLQLSRPAALLKVVIPAIVPSWLVGARLSAMIALGVTVIAEVIVSPRGLGGGLIESMNALQPARIWAYAVVCGTLGSLLNATLRWVVRHGLPGSSVNRAPAGAP